MSNQGYLYSPHQNNGIDIDMLVCIPEGIFELWRTLCAFSLFLKGGLFIFFRGRFWNLFWVPGSKLSCFSDFLVFLWPRRVYGGSYKTSLFRRFPSRLSCRFAWQAWHFVTFQPVLYRVISSFVSKAGAAMRSTLYTLHSTLYTPHSTLHTHSTLHAPHSTLHTPPHSTLHTLHSTLLTLHSTLHTLHFPLPLHTLHYTLFTPQFTL